MKNSFLLLFIAFIANFGFAQAPPQGINYQAVVYSDNGENEPGLNVPGQVLRNKNIRVRFTIIQNATNGTEVYKESHTKTTDAFGMFSLVIGAGTPQGSSTFSNINWGAGLHFLKVEIDKRGGTNYVTMSNQQLLSVPYALYSDKSTYATSAGNGITGVSDNGNGSLTFTYTDGSTYTTPILTGLQGPQGIQGATGAQGPAGQNGTNGVNGTDGINGTNGANGQNGLSAYEIWLTQGNTGTESDFLTAITGAQGPQGIPGQNGTNGVNGTDGINGTNGANGQNGLSAYEIWLAQGNTGTESDFLTAITGATGAQGTQGIQGVAGPTGATGLQGPIGLTGPTGATGTQGIQGATGAAGTNGTDGKNTLAKTTNEAAGANCTTGGVKIEYGLDANNNGTLDVSEVNATLTKYVCNGTVGATGSQGPIGLTGPTGATGATGAQGIQGVAGQTGATGLQGPIGLTGAIGATGAQGIQGATGAAGTNGTNGTNGADGKNTLAKTTTEAAGANCTTGGIKIEYGLDANNNGTLDVSEINASLTKYVCNGAVGATGAQGAQGIQGVAGTNGNNGTNGADGKNTLAKTTTEAAGANCTTGGVKIEYGLDANNNGTLDVSEINVSLTKYVCNGMQGTAGSLNAWSLTGNSGTNPTTNFIGSTDSQDFVLKTNNAERMRITSSGNLGIGTTSPTDKITMQNGGMRINGQFGIGFNDDSFANSLPNGWEGAKIYWEEGTINTSLPNSDYLVLEKKDGNGSIPDGGIAFANRGNNGVRSISMIVNGQGNLGLGTITPSGKFHVNNDVLGSDSSFVIRTNGNVGVGTSNPQSRLVINSDSGVGSGVDSSIVFTNIGHVGIGNSSPDYKLDIGTSDNFNWASRIRNTGGSGYGLLVSSGAPTSNVPVFEVQNNANTSVFSARSNGNVGIGTSTPSTKLEVSGAATNTTTFNAGSSSTIDFSQSNLAYSSATTTAITLSNLKDGGAYSLILTSTTNSGSVVFTAAGFTFKYMGTYAMTSGKSHIYSFIVAGNNVYVSMATEN